MALHPEIQERAQKEVDAIVDTERRLPTMEDCSRLKYVDAVVKEVFRCGEVIPLGVPRQLQTNDIYKDYLLPKGSIIMSNIWYVHFLQQIVLLTDCTKVLVTGSTYI
jgi:cytochrome P450